MRVLCVDHGALIRAYRDRYMAMAALEPQMELTVVAPRALRELNYRGQFDDPGDVDAAKSGYRLVFSTFWPAKVHRGLFGPVRLACLLRRWRPDVIHAHGEPEAWSTGELRLLRDLFTPTSRLIFTSWANVNLFRQGWPYRFGRAYDRCYQYVLSGSQAATVYSGTAAALLVENGFRGPIATIPWGVNPSVFRRDGGEKVRRELGLHGLVVGYVGRLEAAKGVDTLIRAIATYASQCSLFVAGEGPAEKEWKALAAALGVQVHWVGRLSHGSLPQYLSALDVLVLPSRSARSWTEQFGKVLIEAMACEVPVVGSTCGEIPAVIGDAGLTFEEGVPQALAAQLRALGSDGALRVALGKRGRARVLEKYTWDKVAKQTLALYRHTVSSIPTNRPVRGRLVWRVKGTE